MISNKQVANAVGGKTARACDNCIRKRARWYCAADDAFLCQSCDSSVHSANPLARRHERVRLKIASLKSLDAFSKQRTSSVNSLPCWHKGFTRKARTPRHGHVNKPLFSLSKIEEKFRNPFPLVPEVGSDDQLSHEDNNEEEQLRVPNFDPSVAELCTSRTPISNEADQTVVSTNGASAAVGDANRSEMKGSYLQGFLPSEMDLAEFAADVESLLGRGLENESFRMEDLGLVDCKEGKEPKREVCSRSGQMKIEDEEKEEATADFHVGNNEIDMSKEPPFELNLDYDSATCGDEDEKMATQQGDLHNNSGEYEDDDDEQKKNNCNNKKKSKIQLSLDYDAVITAWSGQGTSPWTTGERPDVDPDDCWLDPMLALNTYQGTSGAEFRHLYMNGGGGGNPAMGGEGREARVSRYREKRRTRLFSKKIRYEVRKLNAEKRPRMKGRFVKRGGPVPVPVPVPSFPTRTK